MLSVGKLAAGPSAGRYYEDAVARGREDYYSAEGEGELPGRWIGSGADALELGGEVRDGQVVRLLSGEHPRSGDPLGRPMEDRSVAGFDLTFNAPKSVGLAFAIGDPWTARVLRECHERAVDDALGYLEREACRARRGKDGIHVVKGRGSLRRGSRIARRAQATRCCTRTSSCRTARSARTAAGLRSMRGRCIGTPRRPATSIRPGCATRSPSGPE